MDLDKLILDDPQAAAAAGTHEVLLEFAIKQNDAPFLTCRMQYDHCSDPVVAFITGSFVSMTAPLGPKGKKAADAAFSADLKISVDGNPAGGGNWTGMSRERSLLFERQVLEIWLHMNDVATKQAKAHGQVPV